VKRPPSASSSQVLLLRRVWKDSCPSTSNTFTKPSHAPLHCALRRPPKEQPNLCFTREAEGTSESQDYLRKARLKEWRSLCPNKSHVWIKPTKTTMRIRTRKYDTFQLTYRVINKWVTWARDTKAFKKTPKHNTLRTSVWPSLLPGSGTEAKTPVEAEVSARRNTPQYPGTSSESQIWNYRSVLLLCNDVVSHFFCTRLQPVTTSHCTVSGRNGRALKWN